MARARSASSGQRQLSVYSLLSSACARLMVAVSIALVAVFSCCLVPPAEAASAAEWKSATIYQLLTDRFASSSSNACTDLSSYCGGTFNSIVSKMSYLQQLGVDAVWISPVVDNTDGGYHGYWAKNISRINPKFGSADDLKNLVNSFHSAGMKVMVDVVANHMGPRTDFSQLYPFNRPEHYHCCSCGDCNAPNCRIPDASFDQTDPYNRNLVTKCRLVDLPDLNQDNQFVRGALKDWVKWLVDNFGFDGLRIDTVPEVDAGFWTEFVAASKVFAVGEVFSGNLQLLSSYINSVGSLLNYPMYFALNNVFGVYGAPKSMWTIKNTRNDLQKAFKDVTVLGNFIDNHDNPRFLSAQKDWHMYFNALAYVLFSEGIPIIYYGAEAAFAGGADPQNREPLWAGGYKTDNYIFKYLKAVIQYRKQYQVWQYSQEEVFVSDNCYVFTRGPLMVALTNVGSNQDNYTCTFGVPKSWGGWATVLPTPALAQVDTKITVTFRYGAPGLFVAAPRPDGVAHINSFQALEIPGMIRPQFNNRKNPEDNVFEE